MDDRDIEAIVFQSLGEASMCWNPRPHSQVFDAQHANTIGQKLLAEIRARIIGDRTDELLDEQKRLRAALTLIAIPPSNTMRDDHEFTACTGCAYVAQLALDGHDYRPNVTRLNATEDPGLGPMPLEPPDTEHDQYAMLRDLAAENEEIEVPAVIVRELFAERDELHVDLDECRAIAWQGVKFRARLAGRINRVEEERDQLQGVVDALRGYLYANAEFNEADDEPDLTERYEIMVGNWADLHVLLTELDEHDRGSGR
jgi:hypothetical protein